MRISDWSSDVCSSDLLAASAAPTTACALQERRKPRSFRRRRAGRRNSVDPELLELVPQGTEGDAQGGGLGLVVAVFLQGLLDGGAFDFLDVRGQGAAGGVARASTARSEEHTSELQSLMRISYA